MCDVPVDPIAVNHNFVLGPLETSVMEVLWSKGEASVQDVKECLTRPLAYNTVMTTMNRLYKKHFLTYRKRNRLFLYAPSMSPVDWEQKRVTKWITEFLLKPELSRELVISQLVNAISEHNEALLADLQEAIRLKREQLTASEHRLPS